MPVVTPQIRASATIVPARPVVTISAQAAAASSSQAARPLRGGTRSSRCPSTVPRITAGQELRDHDGRDVRLVAGHVEDLQLQRHDTGPGAQIRDGQGEPEREEAPAGRPDQRPARVRDGAHHRRSSYAPPRTAAPGRSANSRIATGRVTAATYWPAMSVILDGERLTLDEVVRVARGDERVEVACRRARPRPGGARGRRAHGRAGPTASTASRRASACASAWPSAPARWTPTTTGCCTTTASRPARTPRATSCARPCCASRTGSRRAPRACAPSCSRASSMHSTPARRRACARSARRARAISARWPTSPTASAAT